MIPSMIWMECHDKFDTSERRIEAVDTRVVVVPEAEHDDPEVWVQVDTRPERQR